jgi:SagB-type dehydrogenase family enzyme
MNSYHDATKHTYKSVRGKTNFIGWSTQPLQYKSYKSPLKSIVLDFKDEIKRFLYLIGGITAKKSYPSVEYFVRSNPSAGALYPNELYFQARKVDGFDNGIYHIDIKNGEARLLYVLRDDEGVEYHFEDKSLIDGFVFFISSVYYRSSWKYGNRAFRYCLLDGGHLLGSLEFNSYILGKQYNIMYGFDKDTLNQKFGFRSDEFLNSCAIVGNKIDTQSTKFDMQLEYVNPSFVFEKNEMIENAYQDYLKCIIKTPQSQSPSFDFDKIKLQEAIVSRRSIRAFKLRPISKDEFDFIFNALSMRICSDCDEPIDIYYTVHNVLDMQQGLYKNNTLVSEANFSQKSRYLALEQDIGGQSCVTFYLTSNAINNYQAMYQKAGILGHRLYIVSEYLGIGCSGIGAYYDDEVCAFLGEKSMILYMVAIGR